MTDLYPIPNVTDIVGALNYTNQNTCFDVQGANSCGWYGIFGLAAIFLIVFLAGKDVYPAVHCFAGASFISFVLSVLLMVLTLIPVWLVEMFFAFTILSAIILFLSRE